MSGDSFIFKQFTVKQELCAMKVGTDGTLLGAWADGGNSILDIGTGTGLIALMMAQRFINAQITAIDIDMDACRQASINVATSRFADRIMVSCCRVQDFNAQHQFDSIVSNPPFFIDSLKCPDSKRAAARHTHLLNFKELIFSVERLLSKEGTFSVILPMDAQEDFSAEATIKGLFVCRKCLVSTVEGKAPKRVMITFARKRDAMIDYRHEVLVNNNGLRSEWYSRLTEEFYLK